MDANGVLTSIYDPIAGALRVTGGYNPGGTDVAVADGGTGASTDVAARTNLGLQPVAAGYVSGDRIGPSCLTVSGRTVAQGNLFLVPYMARSAVTLDRLYAEVSVVGTGATVIRFGIWNHNPATGKPGTLLLDAGTASGLALAEVNVIISQALTNNWYWFGVVAQTVTGSPSLRGYNGGLAGEGAALLGPSSPITSVWTPNQCFNVAGVTGALGTLVGATFANISTSGPIIQGRVA